MRTPFLCLLALVLVPPVAAAKKLRVAATLPSLAAIAAEVGGEHVTVEALAAPTEDPHYVDPRPDLILVLSRADALLVNGLELEGGWLPPLQVAARNAQIQPGGDGFLDASCHVHLLDVPAGFIDRAMGDIHPGGNPHFLFDPRAVSAVAAEVATLFGRLDPAHAADYAARGKTFRKELLALARDEATRFAGLPAERRRVVVYHKSMEYLLDWLGLEEVLPVEPKPGIPPSPGHVKKVLEAMRAKETRVILQEEFYPTGTSETLAKLAGASLVRLPGGVRFAAGQRYVEYLREITEAIHGALAK
ncbi:MAG: zinc ABC transporter substrate-binding protein [Deltaproteobacteria bacterium]|nr:zinc ABC transporter substrate-binding protein [Deltaproteobacteria bacterium]